MTFHHVMETVGIGYAPLTGFATKRNTCRMASAKYDQLHVGDDVTMKYVMEPGDPDPIAVEQLIVSAVVRGKFIDIANEHFGQNHGLPGGVGPLADLMADCYKCSSDDIRNRDFVFIYFA